MSSGSNTGSDKKGSGGSLFLIVVLIAAVALIGGRRWLSLDLFAGSYTYEDASAYFTGGGRGKTTDITAIEADWQNGEVRVVRGEGGSIVWYDDTDSGEDDEKQLHWRLREDGTLMIRPVASGESARQAKVLTVELPSGYIPKSLNIHAMKADVLCDGLCAESLNIYAEAAVTVRNTVAVNASVELFGAKEPQPLTLGLTADTMAAVNRTGGSIEGRIMAADLTISTLSGNITLELSEGLTPSGTISSEGGNILLTVPSPDFLTDVTILGNAHIQS